jgi:thioredoxin 1
MGPSYEEESQTRADVDALPGATVLEFGNDWCEYCQAAQPAIAAAIRRHGGLRYIKVADGKGRPLGRSFGVKLWPTLIFLRDGREMARTIRPTKEEEVLRGLETIEAVA